MTTYNTGRYYQTIVQEHGLDVQLVTQLWMCYVKFNLAQLDLMNVLYIITRSQHHGPNICLNVVSPGTVEAIRRLGWDFWSSRTCSTYRKTSAQYHQRLHRSLTSQSKL